MILILLAQPNVVLISVDTLRADHLGCYGYDKPTSPNIDALAANGTRWTAAYAPAPVTVPSHATMLTGLYPKDHGALENGMSMNAEPETLAERFKAAGYETHGVISQYLIKAKFGFARGFDTYDDTFKREHTSIQYRGVVGVGIDTEGEEFDQKATYATDKASAVVAAATAPFFLFVHYMDPHNPYLPPVEFAARFSAGVLDERDNQRALYDAEIAYTDHEIGRLLAALPENTIVALVSDHGEGLGDHGEGYHGEHLYDTTTRVVFILNGPGVPKAVNDEPISLVSLKNILLNAAGIESLKPRNPVVLIQMVKATETATAIRSGDCKFIAPGEFYNIKHDPAERVNLLGIVDASGITALVESAVSDADREALEALGYLE